MIHQCNGIFIVFCLSFPFLSQFSDELSKIWRYYDAFLTQTEMLHIGPFHELANSFVNLKVCQSLLYHVLFYASLCLMRMLQVCTPFFRCMYECACTLAALASLLEAFEDISCCKCARVNVFLSVCS